MKGMPWPNGLPRSESAAFVLRYRLAREERSTYSVDEHAMANTRRALRTVRSQGAVWKIDPDRIGILGFSAGGELAALAAMDAGDWPIRLVEWLRDSKLLAADAAR